MPDRTVISKLWGVSLLWGGNYVASAYLLRDFSPILLSFSRLVVMSLFLISVALINGAMRRPTKREWLLLLFAGISGTLVNQLFYFTGLKHSTAGNAALIVALSPIATTLLSRIFLKETITWLKFAGSVTALVGVVCIVLYGGKSLGISLGDVYLLIAMLGLSVSLLFIRKLTVGMTSYEITIYSTVIGTILMSPTVGFEALNGQSHWSHQPLNWLLLIGVAVIGQGLAGFWWNRGIAVVGPSVSAMFMNIPPFVAIVVSHFVLGDEIRAAQIGGGVLILAGVAIANWKPRARPLAQSGQSAGLTQAE
ncbi:DMT family transporter [Paenibacillus sacheonensis]|uniref:EamA family transporter n=1 Tax=Paenibacillus sacheonensis TaxID=742054 RepID=A0A7X4YL12_9BACL|nr:DMT family transporter [Paenibacillus sacheonensis]MBM7563158.1 drug/metabolite transporter (DMT)-like permease [Paenibacillus sacheonensis]NBC68278.1 EamA family transporter [Paenibacillus sacheonensis]